MSYLKGNWTEIHKSEPDGEWIYIMNSGDCIARIDVSNYHRLTCAKLMSSALEMYSALEYFDAVLPNKITGELCVTTEMLLALGKMRVALGKARGEKI